MGTWGKNEIWHTFWFVKPLGKRNCWGIQHRWEDGIGIDPRGEDGIGIDPREEEVIKSEPNCLKERIQYESVIIS